MKREKGRDVEAILLVAIIAVLAAGRLVLATDPPDSAVNPQTNYIEITDATVEGADYEIRHSVDPGPGQPLEISTLTVNAEDDLGSRIVIDGSGDTWVVWWRDSAMPGVHLRKRTLAGGVWSAEKTISDAGEGGRAPEIVHDGNAAWVAYEFDAGGGDTGVAARGISDEPEPFPSRTLLATTAYGGDVDAAIHFEAGNLWATWVDGPVMVGWSEYDYGLDVWSLPLYESYAADDVSSARNRIRTAALAN